MRGEAHDHEYPEEVPIATECSNMSAAILFIAFIWLLVYYLIFLPFNLIHASKASLQEYDDGQLRPRCSVFRSFRQYENLHMLFWILKDLAWNRLQLNTWLLCLFPTLLISVDLLYIAASSSNNVVSENTHMLQCKAPYLRLYVDLFIHTHYAISQDYAVDVVHFAVTLLWVFANSVWAFVSFSCAHCFL